MFLSPFGLEPREEKSSYTLRAQAVDVHTSLPLEPQSEFIIKVQDINDNEPLFPDGPYCASVPEMSPTGRDRNPAEVVNGLNRCSPGKPVPGGFRVNKFNN